MKIRQITSIMIVALMTFGSISFGQNLLNAPEALTYDKDTDRYFVANYNGSIVRIEPHGQQTLLVSGYGVCSGIHLIGNTVYANCGKTYSTINTIKGFNTETGDEVFSLTIQEAAYLNDIVSDEKDENLYLSDFNRAGGKIYKVNIAEKSYSVYLKDLFKLTCGMIFEIEKNRLLFMTGSSEKSLIQSVDLESMIIKDLYTSTEYSAFDCLSKDNKGHYYTSSWRTNTIYSFDENFNDPEIVFTGGIVGPSGFEYIEKLDKIAAPSFSDNCIDFLPLPGSYTQKNLNVYEILLHTVKEKGIDETIKVFDDLKATYGDIYNFDKKMLNRVALKFLADKDFDRYLDVIRLNFKLYPDSKTLAEQLIVALISDNDEPFTLLSDNLLKQKTKTIAENTLNDLGYQLVRLEKTDKALKALELNIKLFPNSGNAYDSYAEILMNNGENEAAIINYKKSLDLNPDNINAKKQLIILSGDDKLIDTGEYKLNCITYGKGNGPSVVLINGMGRDQSYWSSIIPGISSFTTVFSYDPINMGKSDKGPYPQPGDKAVKDLKILLEKRNIPKPYILVGHSFGGLYARLFAGSHPTDVAGLILIDSTPIGLEEAINDILEGKEKEEFSKFITMAPPAMKITKELVKKTTLPQIPLIVLNAGEYGSLRNFSPETRKKTGTITQKLASEMAQLIPGGKEIVVKGAGHIIHVEKPQIVIDAVKEIFNGGIDYFGQKPPGATPEIFAPDIISTNDMEFYLSFSDDGKLCMFIRVSANSSEDKIKYMTKENGKWSKIKNIPYYNLEMNDSYYILDATGKDLYFSSKRPYPDTTQKRKLKKLWKMSFDNQQWSEPQLVNLLTDKDYTVGHPSFTKDGTVYFYSDARTGDLDQADIFFSRIKNGKYGKAQNPGSEINTTANECDPFISPDEKYMLIATSNHPDCMGDDFDIFISFRNKDNSWTKAINLGNKINSEAREIYPRISPDGKYLFFSSNRSGNWDIYWMDTKFIEQLKLACLNNSPN